MKSLLLNYLQYNHWANEKMCNYLSGVDEDEILANKKAEYQTIKKVILHVADSEQTWLARLNGKNIPHMHKLDSSGSFAGICSTIRNNSVDFIEFVSGKDDQFLLSVTEYVNLKGKTFSQNNAEIILHCMNHSTFHRGQVMSMLRYVGYTDQSASDFIMFLREKS
ncbi:MAG: DinB family protein [Sphingobacterium thalpophilum]